jgi:hypothetical protein
MLSNLRSTHSSIIPRTGAAAPRPNAVAPKVIRRKPMPTNAPGARRSELDRGPVAIL